MKVPKPDLDKKRIADSLERIEKILAERFSHAPPPLDGHYCWRFAASGEHYRLFPLAPPKGQTLSSLLGLKEIIDAVERNTKNFLAGKPASNVLLVGARGCGKSSIVRGIFQRYMKKNLRLLETDAEGLAQLYLLQPALAKRREKFIVYCDDFSLNDADEKINHIKRAIEGNLSASDGNLLIYATSNRRNIVKESFADNSFDLSIDGDIQPQENIDDKIALADRFGLRLHLQPPSMQEYEKIAAFYLKQMDVKVTDELLLMSRRYSDQRGAVNGRTARQFAVLVAGGQEI